MCAGLILALIVIKMANSRDVKFVARAICGIIEKAFVKKSERIDETFVEDETKKKETAVVEEDLGEQIKVVEETINEYCLFK